MQEIYYFAEKIFVELFIELNLVVYFDDFSHCVALFILDWFLF